MRAPVAVSTFTIDSLAGFIRHVVDLRRKWGTRKDRPTLWFRGQAKVNWKLTPRLFRLDDADEEEMRIDFQRYGVQLVERQPKDEWDWYFLMQHYGAPTRLLDWTESALAALYFALREKKNADAAVWVLDPSWLNEESIGEDYILLKITAQAKPYLQTLLSAEKSPLPESPVAIDPPHVDRRLAAQRATFTLFGSNPRGLERLAARSKRSRLHKIIIPRRLIETTLDGLAICGVLETTLFPELQSVAKELEYYWA